MNEAQTFHSLTESGPFERYIAKRFKRSEHPMKPLISLVLVLVFAYLPLLVFSTIDGHLYNVSAVDMPFLKDYVSQFRYLLAIPLLILAKPIVAKRTIIVSEYISDYLLDEKERNEVFLPAYEKVKRMTGSLASELVCIFLVAIVSVSLIYYNVEQISLAQLSSWYGEVNEHHIQLSKGGWWSILISANIYRFILLRWFWLYLCWFWLLVKVSTCKLKLFVHHRDKACGLNLLVLPQKSFNMVFVALALSSSGAMINQIVYEHASFETAKMEIIILLAGSFILLLGPLLFFMTKLHEAKEEAEIMMSKKAVQLSNAYNKIWIQTNAVGTEDNQKPDPSLMTDFDSTYDVVEKIRPFPFNVSDLIVLAAPIVLAFVPTLLTNMSLKEIIEVAMRFVV
jgi:hypothetical protein